MSGHRVRYVLTATLLAVLVVVLSATLAGRGGLLSVLVGGGLALGVQLGVFLLLGVLLPPQRRGLAYALGTGFRVFALALLVPLTLVLDLRPAPALLTLVAVFLVTTVLEPLMVELETKRAR